jgi:hypothetical protein
VATHSETCKSRPWLLCEGACVFQGQHADDAEWTYVTRSMGAYAVIDVYDEQDEYVGTL